MKRRARSDKGIFKQNQIVDVGGHYEAIIRNKNKEEVARAKFDKGDIGIVLMCRWFLNNYGYAVNRRFGVMHRLIMEAPEDRMVDHINGNRLDNRRCNLRLATNLQNIVYSPPPITNTSGVKGVSWKKDKQLWRSYYFEHNKQKHIGYFKDFNEAVIARDKVAQQLYGEFAWLSGSCYA